MTLKTLSVRFDLDAIKKAKKITESIRKESGFKITVSDIIRQALAEYISNFENKKKGAK